MVKKIKLFDPTINQDEEIAIKKILKSHFWASGSGVGDVKKFENLFKTYIGSKKCIAVNSGTAALHLALSLFDIKNKEVILPSLSFVSTAHAIIYNGGKPVFIDVDPKNLSMDHQLLEKAITKKTKVILPVHFGGMPCKLDEISEISEKHNLKIVEDAAHAAGASYKTKKIGRHGNAVCFSFHPAKNLAMPSGGAITLNDKNSEKFSDILKRRRWIGITNRKELKYDITDIGWNYYMNEFSAAIGIQQLKKLNKTNLIRKKIAKQYSQELEIDRKILFSDQCSYHLYWIIVKNRDSFIKNMKNNGIETGIHYLPIHKMKFYNSKSKLPITDEITEGIVSLPIHANLKQNDIEKIVKMTNRFAR
jgi:perosamine synthetase